MVTKERMDTRSAEAQWAKHLAEKAKKKEIKELKEKADEYRNMAEEVELYFESVSDKQLLADLRKSRFDFYRLIKVIILKEG